MKIHPNIGPLKWTPWLMITINAAKWSDALFTLSGSHSRKISDQDYLKIVVGCYFQTWGEYMVSVDISINSAFASYVPFVYVLHVFLRMTQHSCLALHNANLVYDIFIMSIVNVMTLLAHYDWWNVIILYSKMFEMFTFCIPQ